MYEVRDLAVLTSAPYLERLNNPTPWTAKMMRSYIGMRRALCEVASSVGLGVGGTALLVRFAVDEDRGAALRDWLAREMLPELAGRPGIVSAHLFATSVAAPMTREQRIRGKDAGLDHAVLVTGYARDVVSALAANELRQECLAAHGAAVADHACGGYDHAFSLACGEVGTG
jgi:hypothetical protein